MRWLLCLIRLFFKYLKFLLIKKDLPHHAEMVYGPISNNNGFATEPRLVGDYADYMTYDNSLWGDDNWKANNDYKSHASMVAWLERNTLYTYKRDVLGMPTQLAGRTQTGSQAINHRTATFGKLVIKQPNGAWQYKAVRKVGSRALILNLGWLLDDESLSVAQLMWSIRFKKVG